MTLSWQSSQHRFQLRLFRHVITVDLAGIVVRMYDAEAEAKAAQATAAAISKTMKPADG